MSQPVLRHIAARWSLVQFPSEVDEWSLDRKFSAIKSAGFDGVAHPPCVSLSDLCSRHGFFLVGFISSSNAAEFQELLRANQDCGAHHVNVHLGTGEMPLSQTADLALALMGQGKRLNVKVSIETHRGTCTETPERIYALADAYQKTTGELLPLTWDFSHLAVVKHLSPENFIERLIVRPDLIQSAHQFHLRPFNGHHCQVPVTDGKGNLTREVRDWLPFAKAVLKCWLEGNRGKDREILVCPEMGPVPGGYNLSALPNGWEDAKVLRVEIEKIWRSLIAG